MRLRPDPEIETFRAELRAWLAANLPDRDEMRAQPSLSSAHLPPWARAWQRRLFDAGLLVPGWPPDLGGRNASAVQQLVYFEEMARIPVRRAYNPAGLGIITPSIRDYASPELQERFVVPTLRGEISWCLGMSEPGAGSDLAGLATRAELRGERFVVNGQKIWTSGAQHSDWCFCFVRTDPQAPKHRGISVLIIDMRSPGIEVRPLPSLTDRLHADFNQVFFNDVEVPANQLVGPLHQGWSITTGSLAHERGMLWIDQSSWIDARIETLRVEAHANRPFTGRRLGADPIFRDRLASAYVDAWALKCMGYAGFAKLQAGRSAPEHSILKLFAAELDQRIRLLATEHLGTEALDVAFDRADPDDSAPWMNQYLFSFAGTIAGGTSEIQRNIIAQRLLGLPRGGTR
jgi:alkylation response protein AidB-like acyl-CoA dehydrogenase